MPLRVPKKIEPKSDREVLIVWNTDEETIIPYFELRYQCPCASCVDEHTGKRTLKREQVKSDVRPLHIVPVGRYAIQIQWNDGHSTGMYPFDSLFKIANLSS
jgi:DUF971 family protein